MTDVSRFKRNPQVLSDGVWKKPDLDEELEIKTKGFTDPYFDKQALRQRRAAKGFGGDIERLPAKLKRQINIESLIDESLMDVRGLKNGDSVVSFDDFCEMLRSGDYPSLVALAFVAANMAQEDRDEDRKDAAGN